MGRGSQLAALGSAWLPQENLGTIPGKHQPNTSPPFCTWFHTARRHQKSYPKQKKAAGTPAPMQPTLSRSLPRRDALLLPSTRASLLQSKAQCLAQEDPESSSGAPVGVAGPARGPGKHNQHCVFKTTSVQMLFPW